MSSGSLHHMGPRRATLLLAVISGAASIAMACWGLSILGGY